MIRHRFIYCVDTAGHLLRCVPHILLLPALCSLVSGLRSKDQKSSSTTVRHLFHLKVSVFNLEINFKNIRFQTSKTPWEPWCHDVRLYDLAVSYSLHYYPPPYPILTQPTLEFWKQEKSAQTRPCLKVTFINIWFSMIRSNRKQNAIQYYTVSLKEAIAILVPTTYFPPLKNCVYNVNQRPSKSRIPEPCDLVLLFARHGRIIYQLKGEPF